MLKSAAHKGRFILAACCVAGIFVVAGALRADLIVSHGFSKALGSQGAAAPFDVSSQSGTPRQGDRDERLRLTRSEVEGPAPFNKRLVVGDRITITGQDGRERVLEITHLKPLGDALTRASTDAPPLRLLLVVCRVVDAAGAEAEKPVRFVMEGEMADPAPPSPSMPKAL